MAEDRDVRTTDGRLIRVRSSGPIGAPCVLYFHGTPDSRLSVDLCASLATSSALHLIAVDRPGYGASEFAPFTLASVAQDARLVMDALGIDRFAVLSQSGGGPFALACAAHLPGRVTGVGIASGPGSFPSVPGAEDDLVETDRQALAMIGIDDVEAARLFALGFADLAGILHGDDSHVLGVLPQMLPADVHIIDRPEFGGLLAAALREGVSQGVSGAAWDNVAWVGPWELDLAAVDQPTFLWYGDEDPLAPPAHGHWLKTQIPHAELVVRGGEGHMGLFMHWDQCISSLAMTIT